MSQFEDWVEIFDSASLETLLGETAGFHDAVSVRASWEGVEFIGDDGFLDLKGYGNMRLLMGFQYPGSKSVELFFVGVESFSYKYLGLGDAKLAIDGGGIYAEISSWKIVASRLRYRFVEAIVASEQFGSADR